MNPVPVRITVAAAADLITTGGEVPAAGVSAVIGAAGPAADRAAAGTEDIKQFVLITARPPLYHP